MSHTARRRRGGPARLGLAVLVLAGAVASARAALVRRRPRDGPQPVESPAPPRLPPAVRPAVRPESRRRFEPAPTGAAATPTATPAVAGATHGRTRRPRPAPIYAVVAVMLLGGAVTTVVVGSALSSSDYAAGAALPGPAQPAFSVPSPARLAGAAPRTAWAPVLRAVTARRAPGRRAPAVARVRARTQEGTHNLVEILGDARRRGGELWVRARLAVLPNGTTGWLPRRALGGYTLVSTRLVVDRRRLRATLYRNGRAVFMAAVGIGRREAPTPPGRFYVRNRLTRYRSPAYGPLAFGTSARSTALTDWPAGGFVGIHGTDRPDLLPGRVSHGCIRMANADILRLGRLMPVGTAVSIR